MDERDELDHEPGSEREEFEGWAKDPADVRSEPERGGAYHPGAASVPKESDDDPSDGMR